VRFGVVTLLPELVRAGGEVGVVGRAVARGEVAIHLENPRDFADDAHRTVDDRPFGGGPGMVMKAAPLASAIDAAKQALPEAPVICLSPQGRVFNQAQARSWQQHGSLILVAGRYEGIDERVIETHIDAEVSMGDFVLSGGEVAAMAIIDVVSRLVPGVLGHPQSAVEDSFGIDGLLDCPHYTRPDVFAESAVPAVLLSGDHQAIAAWRRQQALIRTKNRRPDLLAKAILEPSDNEFLQHLDADAATGSNRHE